MKTASPAMILLLNSGQKLFRADCYTISLHSATGNATRIQSSGGSTTIKYSTAIAVGAAGINYVVRLLVKNQGATSVNISNASGTTTTVLPGQSVQCTTTWTSDGVLNPGIYITTLNAGDAFDIVAFNPVLYKTTDGVNLIAAANQTFATGWTAGAGASITLTQAQEVPNSVLRYTSWSKPLTINGNTFLAGPPNFKRGNVSSKIGTEVATLNMTVDARVIDLVNGIPLLTYIAQQGFNDCPIKVETCFMGTAGDTSAGTIINFQGTIGDCTQAGRSQATLECKSLVAQLQWNTPLRVLQPSCSYTLFDTGCTLSRAAFKVNGIVSSGSTVNKIVATLAAAAGYFDQGVIEFTSGLNAGQKVCVRSYASPSIVMTAALPNVPAAGDTFDIYPGCDKTRTQCGPAKFNNIGNFGGQPFVPPPQVVI